MNYIYHLNNNPAAIMCEPAVEPMADGIDAFVRYMRDILFERDNPHY